MYHEAAIFTHREEPVIAVTKAHALNSCAMGLNLTKVLHGEPPDLHSARVSLLTNSSKKCLFISQNLHLGDVIASLTPILRIICVPNFTRVSRNDGTERLVWYVDDTRNCRVLLVEVLRKSTLSSTLIMQVVIVDTTLVTTVRKAAIVIEPVCVHNLAIVTLTLHVAGAICRVEIIDVI